MNSNTSINVPQGTVSQPPGPGIGYTGPRASPGICKLFLYSAAPGQLLPCLPVKTNMIKEKEETSKKKVTAKARPRGMRTKCFVPGCYDITKKRSGDDMNGERYVMFKAHKGMLEAWRKAIPRADKVFESRHYVCELHFHPEEVQRYYETKLRDGSMFRLARLHPRLLPGSIPSHFPSLPAYLSKTKKTRKPPKERLPLVPKPKRKRSRQAEKNIPQTLHESNSNSYSFSEAPKPFVLNVEQNHFSAQEEITPQTCPKEEIVSQSECEGILDDCFEAVEPLPFTFDVLLKNVEQVMKPSIWWGLTSHGEFLMCAKWNAKYMVERRVVVDRDLEFKVYLKEKEISLDNVDKFNSINEVSQLLKRVDSIMFCPGAQTPGMDNCIGYYEKPEKKRPPWCINCLRCKQKLRYEISRIKNKKDKLNLVIGHRLVNGNSAIEETEKIHSRVLRIRERIEELEEKYELLKSIEVSHDYISGKRTRVRKAAAANDMLDEL